LSVVVSDGDAGAVVVSGGDVGGAVVVSGGDVGGAVVVSGEVGAVVVSVGDAQAMLLSDRVNGGGVSIYPCGLTASSLSGQFVVAVNDTELVPAAMPVWTTVNDFGAALTLLPDVLVRLSEELAGL
jgi:hypothetical protein